MSKLKAESMSSDDLQAMVEAGRQSMEDPLPESLMIPGTVANILTARSTQLAEEVLALRARIEALENVLRVLLTTHPSSTPYREARERARELLGMGAPATPEKQAKVEVCVGQEWTKDVTTVRIISRPFAGNVDVATVTDDGRLIRQRSIILRAFSNTPAGYRLTKEAPEVTP